MDGGTETFETTVREACSLLAEVDSESETVLSLGGGPRDILLPLTVASLVVVEKIDRTLFVSDLDHEVRGWELHDLMTTIADRTTETFESIVAAGGWISLTSIADRTSQSKSTVIRHVNDLEDAGVVESDTSDKSKRVRVAFAGELRHVARNIVGTHEGPAETTGTRFKPPRVLLLQPPESPTGTIEARFKPTGVRLLRPQRDPAETHPK